MLTRTELFRQPEYTEWNVDYLVRSKDSLKVVCSTVSIDYIHISLIIIQTINNSSYNHEARLEEGRSAFKILIGNPTGKRPLGRPRRRWEGNIRMDFEDRYQYG